MKELLRLIICLNFIVSGFAGDRQINVKDFGVLSECEDCTPGLIKALEEFKGPNSAELIFPKGEYHFYPNFGVDKYYFL